MILYLSLIDELNERFDKDLMQLFYLVFQFIKNRITFILDLLFICCGSFFNDLAPLKHKLKKILGKTL